MPQAIRVIDRADEIVVDPAVAGAADVQAALEALDAAGGVTYGTPALTLGTANAAGSTDEAIRRDATILAFDGSAPSTQAFGDSAATGAAAVASRRDHKHAMPANPVTAAAINALGALTIGGALSIEATDVVLRRDAAGVLAQRNGTNNQVFYVYRSYTDASNYERFVIDANQRAFAYERAGTGAAVNFGFQNRSNGSVVFGTNNTSRWAVGSSGHFTAIADNTYDIGANGTERPRAIYFGTSLLPPVGSTAMTTGFVYAPSAAGSPSGTPSVTDRSALYVDTTNGRIYAYYGGAWHYAALT